MPSKRHLIAVSVLTVAAALPARAQEDLSAHDVWRLSLEELMDVRVSAATRMEEPVGEIAASVTIVTRDEIEQHGYATLQDVLAHLPGMYFVENTESIFLGVRGIAGGGVLFLVDGVPQHPSQQKAITMADIAQFDVPVEAIDRIEIVRSPVATVYGNGAFQGLVNVVTDDLESRPAMASAAFGSRGTRHVFLRLGIEADGDRLVVNASHVASAGPDGDFGDMLAPDQLAGLSPFAVTSVDGRLGSDVGRVGAAARWKGVRADFALSRRDYGFYPTAVGLGGENRIELTTWQGSLERRFALRDGLDLRARAIVSGQRYEVPDVSILTPTTTAAQQQTSRRADVELDLVRSGERLDLVVGYRARSIDDVRNDFMITLDPEAVPLEDGVTDLEGYVLHDVYQQLTYRLGSRWRLAGGLRYQRLPAAYRGVQWDRIAEEEEILEARVEDRNTLTGRVSLQYDVATGHRLRVLAGNASQHREAIQIADPEEIASFEFGHVVTSARAQWATSLFLNDIDRIGLRVYELDEATNSTITRVTNDHSWRSLGLEMIGTLRFGDRWRVDGSFVAQRTQDRERDVDVGYSPDLTAKLRVGHRRGAWDLGAHARWVGPMQAGYEFVDGESDVTAPEIVRIGDEVDGYFTLGGSARYEFGGGAFAALRVSNLFDAEVRYPANELTNMRRGLIGMGRVVTFSLGAAGF